MRHRSGTPDVPWPMFSPHMLFFFAVNSSMENVSAFRSVVALVYMNTLFPQEGWSHRGGRRLCRILRGFIPTGRAGRNRSG